MEAGAAGWAEALGVVADLCSVLTLVGVVAVAVVGGRLRVMVIGSARARALAPLVAGRGPLARIRFERACVARLESAETHEERWDPAGEIQWLSDLLHGAESGRAAPLTWSRPELTGPLADALRRYARTLEVSVWAALGSSELATQEVERAGRVASLLDDDSGFLSAQAVALPTPAGVSAGIDLDGVEVLAGPAWCTPDPAARTAQRRAFDEVRVSARPTRHGAFGPFGALEDHWSGLPEPARARLHARAVASACALAAEHPDTYNGELPRLLGWRVEADAAGPTRRLHLLTERTTFVTWLVTNRLAGTPEDDARTWSGEPSVRADHLPVTIGLVTADGYVVLPQRASDVAVYPEQYGSAANGNIELRPRHGVPADVDADGMVDVVGAALRECREELGSGIDLGRDDLRVSALLRYSDARECAAPVLLLAGRSGQGLEEVVRGTRLAHPVEGAFELGREVLGIPTDPGAVALTVPWLRGLRDEGRLSTPAFVSTLLLLAENVGADVVREALARPAVPRRPAGVRRLERDPGAPGRLAGPVRRPRATATVRHRVR